MALAVSVGGCITIHEEGYVLFRFGTFSVYLCPIGSLKNYYGCFMCFLVPRRCLVGDPVFLWYH